MTLLIDILRPKVLELLGGAWHMPLLHLHLPGKLEPDTYIMKSVLWPALALRVMAKCRWPSTCIYSLH